MTGKKQWSADIQVTEALVRSLIGQQFPELAPVQVQSYGVGWDNSLFLVNGSYVFRFPRRTIAADLIEMENRLLPALSARLPLAIPNPCFVGKSTEAYPYAFSGYPKLAGYVPYLLDMTDSKRAQSALRWAEFLRTLHGIPVEESLEWGIAASDDIGRMDVDKRIPLFTEKVEQAHAKGLIEHPSALLSVVGELPTTAHLRKLGSRAVVHGDLNFRNFLVDDEGVLSGVIDWGDAHLGHPAVDLSVAYSFLPRHARTDFFRVYGDVHPETRLLARFRAMYTNIVILLYAHDISDERQLLEAQRALALCAE